MTAPVPTRVSVSADIAYLIEGWPTLVALKTPGSLRSSWVETPRKHVLSESDLDRMGKKGIVRQAPANVGVLDLLSRIAAATDEVTRRVVLVAEVGAQALLSAQLDGQPWAWVWTGPDTEGNEVTWNVDAAESARVVFERKFLPDRSASVDPRPWLRALDTWLGAAQDKDHRTVPWVAYRFGMIVDQLARLLGDVRDGQALNGICPWCRGTVALDADPLGEKITGQRTLQILHPDETDDEDGLPEPLIVCFGHDCTPPSHECGQFWQGRPAWGRREWEWLSTQLGWPEVVPADDVPADGSIEVAV